MEANLIIKQVLKEQSGTSATGEEWKVNTYLGETDEQYPRSIVFEVWKANIDKLNLQVGKKYKVSFDFRAKLSKEGNWFNRFSAWKAEEI